MGAEGVIKFLKMAEEYIQRYPGLTIGYAIGLTAFGVGSDFPAVVERCAALLGSRDISEGYPGGGVLKSEYEAMCARYNQMRRNLWSGWSLELDPGNPATLSETIAKLERLPY